MNTYYIIVTNEGHIERHENIFADSAQEAVNIVRAEKPYIKVWDVFETKTCTDWK